MSRSHGLSRRDFLIRGTAAAGAFALGSLMPAGGIGAAFANGQTGVSKVYFSKEISAESLRKLYALVKPGHNR